MSDSYYWTHWNSVKKIYLSVLIVIFLCIQSGRSRLINSGKEDQTLPSRKVVLISGGSHRFVFRSSNLLIAKNTDVFIFLHKNSSARSWVPSPMMSDIPYPVTPTTISKYFYSKGAQYVNVTMVDAEKERLKLEKAVGSKWMGKLTVFLDETQWKPHSIMLLLRHYAYMAALKYESSQNSFKYSHFLYQREDNVYFTPQPITIPFRPIVDKYRNISEKIPLIVVSKYCYFGALSDKIFYANRLGADHLFSGSFPTFVEFMRIWIEQDRDIFSNTTMQTEALIKGYLTRKNVKIMVDEFYRTELRYIDGTLCIPKLYYECGPTNFTIRAKLLNCDTIYQKLNITTTTTISKATSRLTL